MCQVSPLSAFHPIPFSSRPLFTFRPRCTSFPWFPKKKKKILPLPLQGLQVLFAFPEGILPLCHMTIPSSELSSIATSMARLLWFLSGSGLPLVRAHRNLNSFTMCHYGDFMFIYVTSNVCSFSPLQCKLHEDSNCFCCSQLYSCHPAPFPERNRGILSKYLLTNWMNEWRQRGKQPCMERGKG